MTYCEEKRTDESERRGTSRPGKGERVKAKDVRHDGRHVDIDRHSLPNATTLFSLDGTRQYIDGELRRNCAIH